MAAVALTTDRIAKLRGRYKPYDTRDAKVPGHLVRTQPTGKKDFYFAYRRHSDWRQQYYRIGPVEIGLAAARDIALRLAAEVAGRGDPASRRRVERQAAKAAKAEAEKERDKVAVRRFGAYLTGPYARHAEAEQKRGAEAIARIKAVFPQLLPLCLAEITMQSVMDWRADRLQSGIAATTVDREVSMLSTVLTHATRVSGLLAVNPLQGLKPLASASARTNWLRYLNDEEEMRLRDALRTRDTEMRAERARMNDWLAARGRPALADYPEHLADHLEPIVLTLFNTGLRFGELTQMRWSAVDFRTRLLTVQGDTAKTGKTRHVPMSREVLSVLSRWRTQAHAAPRDLAFPGRRGGELVDIKTAWRALLRRAGIERFRVHDLRHSFASRLVQRGVDLYKVQKLLGHASPTMTQRYAHLAPDHLAGAVAVLDRPQQGQQPENVARA
jgi:integrase